MSQTEVARQVGVTLNHYGAFERGVVIPRLALLAATAKVLEISAGVLAAVFDSGRQPTSLVSPTDLSRVEALGLADVTEEPGRVLGPLALAATVRHLGGGVSQRVVAEEAGIRPSTLSALRLGRTSSPELETIVRLAHALALIHRYSFESVLTQMVCAFSGEVGIPLAPEAWARNA